MTTDRAHRPLPTEGPVVAATRSRWTIALLTFFLPLLVAGWLAWRRSESNALLVVLEDPDATYSLAPGDPPTPERLVVRIDPDDPRLPAIPLPEDPSHAFEVWNPGFSMPDDPIRANYRYGGQGADGATRCQGLLMFADELSGGYQAFLVFAAGTRSGPARGRVIKIVAPHRSTSIEVVPPTFRERAFHAIGQKVVVRAKP